MPFDTLSFIAESLASLLSNAILDRIKPKTPAANAKIKLFRLYEILRNIEDETDYYIKNLVRYLRAIQIREDVDLIGEKKGLLRESVQKIWELMDELNKALININPQLEIYNHELYSEIEKYQMVRKAIRFSMQAELLMEVSGRMNRLESTQATNSKPNKNSNLETDEIGKLRKLLSEVKKNQKSIKKIINNYREFISREFEFKDSF
jgi:hypothetical protein